MVVNILILGAGWTSTFLIPLCTKRNIAHAATTRTGRDSTIKFEYNPDSDDIEAYRILPDAQTVLIAFPIVKQGAAQRLVKLYHASRKDEVHQAAFIQLGATSIWDGTRKTTSLKPPDNKWYDRHSPYIHSERANAEDELLSLSPNVATTVLNLAGLWGGARSMRNWVGKVAPTKEALKNKGSIHMIHGLDVARAILAVHENITKASGQRWILTDGRVYDWWDLASAWGSSPITGNSFLETGDRHTGEDESGPQARWVRELMREEEVRALPRNIEILGRALDSRDFWLEFGLSPLKARLEG